ncbi:MAG: peptide chain release factor 1 [Deltaproteobacteria bacterium]|nr:peptide chain release factor 1 [Deltaproteobacteria bacterium]
MFSKLDDVTRQFDAIEAKLATPEVATNHARYIQLMKERSGLADIVETYREYQKVARDLEGAREMSEDKDPDVRQMAHDEIESLSARHDELHEQLLVLLLPKDPLDEKNIILEIRAGTGGEEAALFAGDLFRAYARYAEERRWKMEMMSRNETGRGGFKEVIVGVAGDRVYSRLKFESGVHRVQRVPETEAQGRIHTSAVTVAVLPEPDDVEVDINDNDLKIDVYRSSGPGGQSVNTTDSAVRITHLPTGLVVAIQDEKSQHKNKAKALKVLQARLLERQIAEQQAQISAERKSMVGTGDRSERIRTYNFPQNRLTDHRIGLTLYQLDRIMEGRLDDVIEPLIASMNAEALKAQSDASA